MRTLIALMIAACLTPASATEPWEVIPGPDYNQPVQPAPFYGTPGVFTDPATGSQSFVVKPPGYALYNTTPGIGYHTPAGRWLRRLFGYDVGDEPSDATDAVEWEPSEVDVGRDDYR